MFKEFLARFDLKTILIIILSIIVLVLAFGMSLLIMHNVEKDREIKNTPESKVVDKNIKYHGTITRVEEGRVYFKAEGSDVEESTESNCEHAQVGSPITFRINENGEKYGFSVAVEHDGKISYYQLYEHTETNTTTSKTTITTTTEINNPVSADDSVLKYINNKNDEISNLNNNEDNKGKAKEYFVSLVDFIFYGGTIQGHTFNELSSSAKEKTIYLTLKLDSIVDKNIPGYKDTLGDSYKNAKNQLLANYTEYSVKICSENKEFCDDIKRDTKDLKKSLNISWSIIKDVYNEIIKPAGKSGVQKLSEWYEVWKNA